MTDSKTACGQVKTTGESVAQKLTSHHTVPLIKQKEITGIDKLIPVIERAVTVQEKQYQESTKLDLFSFIPLLISFFGILITLVGWWIIIKDNRKRDNRRDLRYLIKDLEKDLLALYEDAYSVCIGTSIKSKTHIKVELRGINELVTFLDKPNNPSVLFDQFLSCVDEPLSEILLKKGLYSSDSEDLIKLNESINKFIYELNTYYLSLYSLKLDKGKVVT